MGIVLRDVMSPHPKPFESDLGPITSVPHFETAITTSASKLDEVSSYRALNLISNLSLCDTDTQ